MQYFSISFHQLSKINAYYIYYVKLQIILLLREFKVCNQGNKLRPKIKTILGGYKATWNTQTRVTNNSSAQL